MINLLENIQGIEATLPNIIEYFIKELNVAKTPDYKSMLMQGLSICLWYNASATLGALEAMNATSNVLAFMFQIIPTLKQDFEV